MLICSSPRVSLAERGHDMSSLSVLDSRACAETLQLDSEPLLVQLVNGKLLRMTIRSSLATKAPPPGSGGAKGLIDVAVVSSQLHSER